MLENIEVGMDIGYRKLVLDITNIKYADLPAGKIIKVDDNNYIECTETSITGYGTGKIIYIYYENKAIEIMLEIFPDDSIEDIMSTLEYELPYDFGVVTELDGSSSFFKVGESKKTYVRNKNKELVEMYSKEKVDEMLKEKNIITAYLSQQLYSITERYQTIPLEVSNVTGNKLSLENNAVKIGKGVSKVLISAVVFYQDYGAETVYLFPRIDVNGTNVAKTIGSICSDTTRYQSITFAPFMINVKEGDLITLLSGEISPNDIGTIRGYDQNSLCTYMTVEVVG